MAYTAGTRHNFESEIMGVGEHIAKIVHVKFRDYTDANGIEFKNISITWKNENDEIMWDTIYQNYNEETMTIDYDNRKLDRYSNVLGIEEGTNFPTYEAWMDAILHREAIIVVDINPRTERTRIAYIKKYEGAENVNPF